MKLSNRSVWMVFSAISAVAVKHILTSKAQHEGRVRAIVKMCFTATAEIAVVFSLSNYLYILLSQ